MFVINFGNDWIRTADLWYTTTLPTEPQPLPCAASFSLDFQVQQVTLKCHGWLSKVHNQSLFKNGQTRPHLVYFHSFHMTKIAQILYMIKA